MAKSNRDRISDVMDTLQTGLAPYVLREYKQFYKATRYLQEIEFNLNSNAYSAPALPDEATALTQVDVQGWLKLIWNQRSDVFRDKLGFAERNYVSELMTARNDWAHQKAFSNDDAQRVADTASRLLRAVGAIKEAESTQTIMRELRRLSYEAEMKQSIKPASRGEESAAPTLPGLKPWRQVVQPHPDVASGRYLQAEFAADLAQVVQGKADPEYGDPKEFFRRTYLTEGLLDLLTTGIKRLTGLGGDPVVQLQTSFGGGKTHSMLALYHLLGGQIGFSEIPGGEQIVKRLGARTSRPPLAADETSALPVAKRAVIVGTAFSATEPRGYADVTTHTLWGDLAYQLGGVAAYQMVERADLAGVSPGADTLVELLEKFGPALLIIDELVAYARNLYNVSERLPSGSFEAVMTFFQALTEAVKRSSNSMLLVSIPESDIEIGGAGGKATQEILAKTIGRVEAVWKPVTATESFEIVRRRLFSSEMDYAARDGVLAAFLELYKQNRSEFPAGVAEGDYLRRMKDAYPIHPELFARLYEDWSTLDRFQRTRGVLRLMATVIHRLWQDNDQSLLIMPGSIPLWAATVRNEILRYLPENWPAIVDTDIDGEAAKPYQLDRSIPTLGQYTASRRVARAIFIGSAPSVAAQNVRGVEEVRIRLATVQPGEQLAAFNDALRRMSNQLTYLYSDGSRYWYDTRPTVNRMAQDRAQTIHPDKIHAEVLIRLRALKFRREDFAAAHILPPTAGDVADEGRVRVVILGLEQTHKKGNIISAAQLAAQQILEQRGNAPRLYRNMLLFIAPDVDNAAAWQKALCDYLAWQSIHDDAESEILNLDAHQRKQVKTNLATAENTVLTRLQETYCWLLVPTQPQPTGPIELQARRIDGDGNFYERAARKLRSGGELIANWSPDNLRIELDSYLWLDQPHLKLKQLWEYLARYCYLPRLANEEVLLAAVRAGLPRIGAPFAYANGVGADGVYKGLVLGEHASQLYMDDNAVLVRPEIAQQQLAGGRDVRVPSDIVGTRTSRPPVVDGAADRAADGTSALPVVTRYHGSVLLDPQRANKEMAILVEEIIQRLTSLVGTTVELTLEIRADRASGFDEVTLRTINENSRTLKFKSHSFDEG